MAQPTITLEFGRLQSEPIVCANAPAGLLDMDTQFRASNANSSLELSQQLLYESARGQVQYAALVSWICYALTSEALASAQPNLRAAPCWCPWL